MIVKGKSAGLSEAVLVVLLFFYILQLLRKIDFGQWQEPLFGSSIVSGSLLLFVLPLVFIWILGSSWESTGLSNNDLKYQFQVAARAMMYVFPATLVFPLIGFLGTTPMHWLGSSLLTIGFAVGGLVFALNSRDLVGRSEQVFRWRSMTGYLALLVVGLIGSYLLHPISPVAARVVEKLIFVGFLEEFFFRGYLQTRLNEVFGKPFKFANVSFGPALILAAIVFGLFHPLTVVNDTPWAWALWTCIFGLVVGFVREKTGSFISSAVLHGVLVLPTAFLSGT